MITKSRFIAEFDSVDGLHVNFKHQVYEDDAQSPHRYTRIDKEVWSAMGSPQVVTVSIEPGDMLNL